MTSYNDYLLMMEHSQGTQILSEEEYAYVVDILGQHGDTVEEVYQMEVDLGRATPLDQITRDSGSNLSPIVILIALAAVLYYVAR